MFSRFVKHPNSGPEDYAAVWAEIVTKYPSSAPVDLGSMGYDGAISTYFARSILAESYFQAQ